MRVLLLLFLIFPILLFSQNLKQVKATVQTINHGISPTASTNYVLLYKKEKSFNWSIDSVYSVADNKKVKFNIVAIDNPELVSPTYTAINKFEKKYKGYVQLTFSSIVSRGEGRSRPNAPQPEIEESNDYSKGVIIYCTIKKKKKQIRIESFEKLETINAP